MQVEIEREWNIEQIVADFLLYQVPVTVHEPDEMRPLGQILVHHDLTSEERTSLEALGYRFIEG